MTPFFKFQEKTQSPGLFSPSMRLSTGVCLSKRLQYVIQFICFADVEYESGDSSDGGAEKRLSSSDSEPDDVGFDESRKETLGRVKLAVQQIKTEKERKKLKRKERDDMYKQQKVIGGLTSTDAIFFSEN